MAPHPISHITLGTNDFARAAAFYHVVLGVLGFARLSKPAAQAVSDDAEG